MALLSGVYCISKLNPEVKSRTIGLNAQMGTFKFSYGVFLSECIMKQVDNLSKILQSSTISAAEGQRIAGLTIVALEMINNEENFDLFWKLVQKQASLTDRYVEESALPRRKRVQLCFDTGSGESNFVLTTKEYYRQYYYEVLNLAVNSIRSRFEQSRFKRCKILQNLLLSAVNGKSFEDDFEEVTSFYDTDIDSSALKESGDFFSITLTTNF